MVREAGWLERWLRGQECELNCRGYKFGCQHQQQAAPPAPGHLICSSGFCKYFHSHLPTCTNIQTYTCIHMSVLIVFLRKKLGTKGCHLGLSNPHVQDVVLQQMKSFGFAAPSDPRSWRCALLLCEACSSCPQRPV